MAGDRKQCVVIGLGNPFRSDDGVGLAVAEGLRKCALPDSVEVMDVGMDELGLIEIFGSTDRVVIVDAVSMGQRPGTIRVFPLQSGASGPTPRNISLHALGLRDVAALSASLGSRPSLVIVGIEPESTAPGDRLSQTVSSRTDRLAAEVLRVVSGDYDVKGSAGVVLPENPQ